MRPKKRILLVDTNENRLSVRRYMLTTRGFAVVGAGTVDEAFELAEEFKPELVIGCWTIDIDLKRLFDRMSYVCVVPTMLVAEKLKERPEGVFADAVLLGAAASSAELVDRAKLLSQRKRGPKKMPAVETAAALEARRSA